MGVWRLKSLKTKKEIALIFMEAAERIKMHLVALNFAMSGKSALKIVAK